MKIIDTAKYVTEFFRNWANGAIELCLAPCFRTGNIFTFAELKSRQISNGLLN